MVAEAYVAVDVEAAVRTWVRSRGFTAFFGVNNHGAFPQVVLWKVRGTSDGSLIQFDVWGGTKADAAQAAGALASALSGMSTYDTNGVRLHGADVVNDGQWLPDPATDKPRYVVEATVTATAI
jgi:hypothetical protein